MSEAAIGLVGVLLGGIIAAGSQWLRERTNTRREKATASRLIQSELGDAVAAINFATKTNKWWPNDLSRADWDRYVAVLTGALSMKEWLVVLAGHDAVERMNRTREAHGGSLATLAAGAKSDLDDEKKKIEKAMTWLDPHAYRFGWWKLHRHVQIWAAKKALHKDGPKVPT